MPTDGGVAQASLVDKWRRGTAGITPVVVAGQLEYRHIEAILRLAYDFGLPNVFFKPGRFVEAPSGRVFLRLSDRRMTTKDVELAAAMLWRTGNATGEMLQGKSIDFRFDMRLEETGEFLLFRGSMSKIDGVGTNGYSISLRTFASAPPKWEDMKIERAITDNLFPDRGLVMFVGKTDSGKTTLQASAIDFIARRADRPINLLEYGAPLEYPHDDSGSESFRYCGYNMGVDLIPPTEWRTGLISFACFHALRNAPNLIAISECRDGNAFEGVVETGLAGAPVITTAHTSGPGDTINRMCASIPAEGRDGFASSLLSALRLVVHQRLIPSAQGGRVAMREYLVFTPELKEHLQTMEHPKWAGEIAALMQAGDPDIAQSFKTHLDRLLAGGEITPDVYQETINRSASFE